jgi:hypothetical protein
MKSRTMKLVPLLVIVLLGSASLGEALAQGGSTLSGHITVGAPVRAQTQAQAALPLLTARLYFSKQTGKPALLTYTDAAGNFRFTDVPAGSYLLEIYVGDRMLYQKVVTLRGDMKLDIHLGDVVVVERVRLEQRHRRILTEPEFQGKVTVYVGDIHKTKPFPLLIFVTGPAASRWRDSSRIELNEVRAVVPKTGMLFDGTLSSPSKLEAQFVYNRQNYVLAGSVRASTLGKDYLDFDVYRQAPREESRPPSVKK